jgi:hypothetical protein
MDAVNLPVVFYFEPRLLGKGDYPSSHMQDKKIKKRGIAGVRCFVAFSNVRVLCTRHRTHEVPSSALFIRSNTIKR